MLDVTILANSLWQIKLNDW